MSQGRHHPCLPLLWGDVPVTLAQLSVLSMEIRKSIAFVRRPQEEGELGFFEPEAGLDLVSAFYDLVPYPPASQKAEQESKEVTNYCPNPTSTPPPPSPTGTQGSHCSGSGRVSAVSSLPSPCSQRRQELKGSVQTIPFHRDAPISPGLLGNSTRQKLLFPPSAPSTRPKECLIR